jgi:hypothetical protein
MKKLLCRAIELVFRERLAERMQKELNREHSLALGWFVTTGHDEIGLVRGECPDVDEQSMINRVWRKK